VMPHAIGIGLEAGAAFMPAAVMLVAYWKNKEVDLAHVRGSWNADPLAVYARDGRLPVSLDAAYCQMTDLAAWTHEHLPNVTSIRVGTGPYHHAGATAAQDVAFSMATAA